MTEFPQRDKLASSLGVAQACRDFVEWLKTRGIELFQTEGLGYFDDVQIEQIIDEYLGIDTGALADEAIDAGYEAGEQYK
jgi:hypothetical protein